MKKILAFILVIVMAFCFTACGNTQEESVVTIGFAVSTLSDASFVALVEGAQTKTEELGIKLIVTNAEGEATKQASDINDLVTAGVQALIVNPVDCNAISTAIESAIKSGIKVVVVGNDVKGIGAHCSISSDDILSAKLVTDYLVGKVGKGALCVEIQGTIGNPITIDRGEGFHSVADTSLKVVSMESANFNREEATSVMEGMLKAYPGITCVFAHDDEMALGAVDAIGEKRIYVVGLGGTDAALAAVQAGTMLATVAQQPVLMGSTAVEKASSLIKGESVEDSITIETFLVTADNVTDFIKW